MNDRIRELKFIIDNHPDNTHTTLTPFIPRICSDLGVKKTTLYRWVNGTQKPHKKAIRRMIPVVEKYLKEIKTMNKDGFSRKKDNLDQPLTA